MEPTVILVTAALGGQVATYKTNSLFTEVQGLVSFQPEGSKSRLTIPTAHVIFIEEMSESVFLEREKAQAEPEEVVTDEVIAE